MILTLEPTKEFYLTNEGIPMRAWTGTTDRGTRVVAFIAAITSSDENPADLNAELRTIPGPAILEGRIIPASEKELP